MTEQIRKVFIPSQYVAKKPWRNDMGNSYRIISCIDIDDQSLSKIFVEPQKFMELGFAGYCKTGQCVAITEEVDDDDRGSAIASQVLPLTIAFKDLL